MWSSEFRVGSIEKVDDHAESLQHAAWFGNENRLLDGVDSRAASISAQSARNLTRVKKVFVPSFSEGNGAAELYQSLVKQLRKSGT